MSDAALRELERAAHAGGDADAWTRLAQAQARAGQGGARSAVQALLRDPAAPVRELLVAGETPGPRAQAAPAAIVLRGAGAGGGDPVDLGEGRVLLPREGELVALDVFRGGEVLWRQPRVATPLVGSPILVGERVVEHGGVDGPALAVVSRSALTGQPLATLSLPDALGRSLLLGPHGRLLPLDADRCVAVVEGQGSTSLAFCDLERGALLAVAPDLEGELGLQQVGGALAISLDDELSAREADGVVRWSARLGEPVTVVAAAGDLLAVLLGDLRTPALVAAVDGARLATLEGASWEAATFGDGLLVGAFERPDTHHLVLEGWEARATPVRRWGVALGGAGANTLHDLRAAGDVLLVTWRSAGRAPMGATEVTALDLATGQRLWSRVVDPGWSVGLAGGCLVEVGPSQGWLRPTTPVRWLGPA